MSNKTFPPGLFPPLKQFFPSSFSISPLLIFYTRSIRVYVHALEAGFFRNWGYTVDIRLYLYLWGGPYNLEPTAPFSTLEWSPIPMPLSTLFNFNKFLVSQYGVSNLVFLRFKIWDCCSFSTDCLHQFNVLLLAQLSVL